MPYLVRDINTTFSQERGSSDPSEFTAFGGRIFFVARTEETGAELWSMDAGGAGPALFADLVPGSRGSEPSGLRVMGNRMFFTARTPEHGGELWVTDGTVAGTRMLLDINPGEGWSSPGSKFVIGERMLFSAEDATTGRELWITDGTAAGTQRLADLRPGAPSSSPASLTLVGNTVYFGTTNGLWKTDGTEAGTVIVRGGVVPSFITVVGTRLFFRGGTLFGTNAEPWVSDGTEAGTRMVADIAPGTIGSLSSRAPTGFTVVGDRVLFFAHDNVHGRELWSSDGTAEGTRMLREVVPGQEGYDELDEPFIGVLDGRAYFPGRDDQHGFELWVTDGTDAGTMLFADLAPGAEPSYARVRAVLGGQLLFTVHMPGADYGQLWTTDGTAGGTRVIDAGTSFGWATSRFVQTIGGKMYFTGETVLTGSEPWVTDGTGAGTHMIANLASDGAPSSTPTRLTAAGGLLFFHATEGLISPETGTRGSSLWRSDGTATGTFKLMESTQHPNQLTAAGPFVLFRGSSFLPWTISDGTVEGTRPADDFLARFGQREVNAFYPFGDTLFASVENPGGFSESLWVTTAAAGAPATQLGSIQPRDMVEVAGHYLFYSGASNDPSNSVLWRTDGTPAGTYAVTPGYKGGSPLVNAGGTIYFSRDSVLWKSDGTFDGTTAVKAFPERGVGPLTAVGRRVFFASGDALWTSDGTEAGTVKLVDLPNIPWFHADSMVAAGDRLVFVQRDGSLISDLWSSDGTPDGTRKLMQLEEGGRLTSIEGIAYFATTDDQHGSEPWTTDGTPEGTRLLFDLNPGPAGSRPAEFTKVGDTIYFTAYTAATGAELWALPLTEPRLSVADGRAAEGDAIRFTVSLGSPPAGAVTVGYTTADGTARAGEDYEAASGTLTFAPGERTRTVDVRVLGDDAAETDEQFSLTLRDPSIGRLVKAEGAGIIGDDDRAVDLSLAIAFENNFGLEDRLTVSNAGPSGATEIEVRTTATPDFDGQRCDPCRVPQLAPGASAETGGNDSSFVQEYRSAIVTARQPDREPSNNTVTWTSGQEGRMVMTPAWLTTGATGTITAYVRGTTATATSSDPSVVAIPATLPPVSGETVTFTATALKPGTSTITVVSPLTNPATLLVTVAAPGETLRWKFGVQMGVSFESEARIDLPFTMTVTPTGMVPVTGATATGTVIVSAGGLELARQTISGSAPTSFPVYFRSTGSNTIHFAYSGDANFLPEERDHHVFNVLRGIATLTAEAERTADEKVLLMVRATGSPVVLPTGLLLILHEGRQVGAATLSPSQAGASAAQLTLTGLPPVATLTIEYQGDARYHPGSQQVRLPAKPRQRSVRH